MSTANPALEAPRSQIVLARIVASDGDGTVVLGIGDTRVRASVDASVHPAVVAGALSRQERVLAQHENGAWIVMGALRTAPTPGIDAADEYVIRAGRVRVEAAHEFSVVSGLSSIAVRAYGHVETLADQITSRAASVHKVVGRMLHLN
jgi:hypothetical protein